MQRSKQSTSQGKRIRHARVTALAPAKLNLTLRVTGRRTDGYHLLDSFMVPISIFDRLEIQISAAESPAVRSTCNHPDVPEGPANLAHRAAHTFLARFGPAAVDLRLEKDIPIGSGLGGASSDAAAVLRALSLTCPVDYESLLEIALELGADVPFFLRGEPARVRGIGEVVEPVSTPITSGIVVAFLGKPISTATVYRAYDDSLTIRQEPTSKSEFPEASAQFRLFNDLEDVAVGMEPALRGLKEQLYGLGAREVSMTGSGSAIFGLWQDERQARQAVVRLQAQGVWSRYAEVLDRTPDLAVVIQ